MMCLSSILFFCTKFKFSTPLQPLWLVVHRKREKGGRAFTISSAFALDFNFHPPSNHCGLWYIERERKEAEPLQYDLLLLSLFTCWPASELVVQPLCFESPRLENVYCSGKKGTLWTSCAALHIGIDK